MRGIFNIARHCPRSTWYSRPRCTALGALTRLLSVYVILLYHRIILQEWNIKSVLLQKPWASINKLTQLLHANIYLSAAKWCQGMYSFSKVSKSLSVNTVLCEDKSSFLCRFFANLPLLCWRICKSRREYWQVVIVIHLLQCNSYHYRWVFSPTLVPWLGKCACLYWVCDRPSCKIKM